MWANGKQKITIKKKNKKKHYTVYTPPLLLNSTRSRNPDVALVDRLIDYVQFCGSGATDKEQGISILDKQLRLGKASIRA